MLLFGASCFSVDPFLEGDCVQESKQEDTNNRYLINKMVVNLPSESISAKTLAFCYLI